MCFGANLLALPYFAAVWSFTEYAGAIATPWTIGWIILWLIYSPIVTWAGVYLFAWARWPMMGFVAALVAAVPFWPDAIWMLVTMFVSAVLGAVFQVWITIAVFVAIVCGVWVWYHGGIVL